MKRTVIVAAWLAMSLAGPLCAQQTEELTITGPRILSMEDVVRLAQEKSISAMVNRNAFAAAYWSYRSFKAQYLPSLNLSGGLGNFDRNLSKVQDFNTGAWDYVQNYSMTNDLTLSIRQNVALTGGTLSLSTQLQRLDQFGDYHNTMWMTKPIFLSYMQSLSGYNSLKWDKKIEPNNYEIAKREYLENMESVTINAVDYFWSLNAAQVEYNNAMQSFDESKRLYQAAQERFRMGTITRDNLLQLELKMLNDSLSIRSREVSLKSAQNRLCSYIGYKEDTELKLTISYVIPDITLLYDDVLEKALENSSFSLSQTVQSLNADRSVAQARANTGITADIHATFGMTNNAGNLRNAFSGMSDQESVGVSFAVPIVDWGLGKGRVQMAKAQAETTKNRLEQSLLDYRQNLMVSVMQFNNQRSQCEISRRAADIAEESYELALRNFGTGSMSVTTLNQLQSTRDNARTTYESNVRSFWNQYFNMRKTTLYDYISGTDISAEFDRIVK